MDFKFNIKVSFISAFLVIELCHCLLPTFRTIPKPTKRAGIGESNGVCIGHAVGEFVKHPNDCKFFYLCKENGVGVVATCPPTMLFNDKNKICDRAANVQCDVGTPPTNGPNTSPWATQSTGTTTTVNARNDAELYCASLPPQVNSIMFVGSSTNCRQYYICYYGKALLQECSANLHFNMRIGKCDLPVNANCTAAWQPPTTALIPTTSAPSSIPDQNYSIDCPLYGQHIFPHMGSCDLFIYCVKGHSILQKCPFYYHYDIATRSCKRRTGAGCNRNLNFNFQ